MRGIINHVESLRAIAVLSVFVNHIDHSWLPGGYLGVDIFFVISGFVITRSLLRLDNGSIWDRITLFYSKRVKRIVPALSLVIISAIILNRLVNPAPKIPDATGATAMLGASNIFLYLISVDYFGETNKLNPLMHTWSLGVEEQFYLLYPILFFWTLSKLEGERKLLIIFISILTVFSLLLFTFFTNSHQTLVYYLMPFRAWELGVGCLLALFVFTIKPQYAKVIQILALLSIITAFSVGDKSHIVSTILSVIGSVGLILTGSHKSVLNRVFVSTYLQYIGRLSYSIYLWHWLVICLAIWTIGINWISIPIIVVFTFFISILSFHLIEEPARERAWFSPTLNIASGLLIMISITVLILLMNKYDIPEFTGSEAAAIARTGYRPNAGVHLDSQRLIKNCMGGKISNDTNSAKKAIENCKAESDSGPRFIFFGDSHSMDMFGASELLFQQKVGTVINFGQNGCRAPRRENEPDFCNYPETVMTVMPPLDNGQKGFVVLRNNVFPRLIDGSLGSYVPRIEAFYERMRRIGYDVIWVANNSAFPSLEKGGLCTEQWFRPTWAFSEKCNEGAIVSYKEQIGRRTDFFNALKQLEKKYVHFHVFDPIYAFCTPQKNICESVRDGIPLYRDTTHLTFAGAKVLGDAFLSFLYEKKLVSHN
jgi:peptidoglycan/LPS O-acetylase OafA/YrhL